MFEGNQKHNKANRMKTGKYRHFKGGEYQVQGVARHSETGELLVVYSPLYGEGGLWVRPLSTHTHKESSERNDWMKMNTCTSPSLLY